MPTRAKRLCNHPGCNEIVDEGYCSKHTKKRVYNKAKQKDNRASSAKRGYDSKWQEARKIYLTQHPLCVQCSKEKKLTPATVIDHIIPHKGNVNKFWDKTNWQPLCKRCHDTKTAKEDGGFGNK